MLYNGLLRVPCPILGPCIPAGKVVDDPVNTLDILANATGLAGLAAPETHGRSWRGLWDGHESRDFALSEYEVDAARSAVDMDLMTIRSDRYRMSIDLRTDTGELYDLQKDPHEMTSRFYDPAFRRIRKQHRDLYRTRPSDVIPAAPRVGWH